MFPEAVAQLTRYAKGLCGGEVTLHNGEFELRTIARQHYLSLFDNVIPHIKALLYEHKYNLLNQFAPDIESSRYSQYYLYLKKNAEDPAARPMRSKRQDTSASPEGTHYTLSILQLRSCKCAPKAV
ncbi:predicted protein [Plenodomus lingam JN3]|uniref:Predicted protein n=1 Tax=Leptosphaeria maculans (strain JN3 / isolate v23.1.3 / race Av1-4-5-6-7-8) TaxID=985895 RepID=E5A498_LEPMJ|nr:predicted protein [Plenodomus lingam JN3]CBX98443.1 predicted protein [Plenodomus lingam JN3]